MVDLNEKETMFLKDEKKHEELCIKKYDSYSQKACDPELKNLFTKLKGNEQTHLNTINEILSGSVPSMSSSSGSSNASSSSSVQNQSSNSQSMQNNTESSNKDATLCDDSLSTEKYVSSTYNTAIFEFRDPQIRQALNHIQKEEQEHGEQIYNYMSSHGMYN